MNKRYYIAPTTEEYTFQSELMLNAASQLKVDSTETNGVDNEEDVLSRRTFSLWGDEE